MRAFQPEMKGQVEAEVTNLPDVSGTLSDIHSRMEKADPRNVDPAASQNALFQ